MSTTYPDANWVETMGTFAIPGTHQHINIKNIKTLVTSMPAQTHQSKMAADYSAVKPPPHVEGQLTPWKVVGLAYEQTAHPCVVYTCYALVEDEEELPDARCETCRKPIWYDRPHHDWIDGHSYMLGMWWWR